jgi:hypothetical protein
MPAKLTYEKVNKIFKEYGYQLLTDFYTHSTQRFLAKCPNNHIRKVTLDSLKRMKCSECTGNKKFTYDFVKQEFENKKYVLVSKKYLGICTKLDVLCPNGHDYSVSFNNFHNHGSICSTCTKKKKLTLKEVGNIFQREGYTLLSTEYLNVDTSLLTLCPEKHQYKVDLYHFKNRGQRCTECSSHRPATINEVKSSVLGFGYILLSQFYKNSTSPIKLLCPKEHEWETTYHSFKDNKARCPVCQFCGISAPEKELFAL